MGRTDRVSVLIQTGLDSHPHMELKHLTELTMSDPLSRLRLTYHLARHPVSLDRLRTKTCLKL